MTYVARGSDLHYISMGQLPSQAYACLGKGEVSFCWVRAVVRNVCGSAGRLAAET